MNLLWPLEIWEESESRNVSESESSSATSSKLGQLSILSLLWNLSELNTYLYTELKGWGPGANPSITHRCSGKPADTRGVEEKNMASQQWHVTYSWWKNPANQPRLVYSLPH